ncbi:MAG TPA: hypothetical protein VFF28_02350 [Candidatus Nanoarchaeia archaeon]|nr:hypothetical protein [Candidatus Nanoarchaeia archaeon]
MPSVALLKIKSVARKIFRVSKVILTASIPMNFLLLAVIIFISVASFEYFEPEELPVGDVVLEPVDCEPVYLESKPDCNLCPIKTKIEQTTKTVYRCPHGETVEDLDDCKFFLPNVSALPSGVVDGITLAIGSIQFEDDGAQGGFVTAVEYTIINQGKAPIVPKLEVKTYDEWTLKAKKSEPNKVIIPEIVINPGDFVKRTDKVRIYFEGDKQTVRLLLVDSLPAIEKDIIAVAKDIKLG